MFVWYKFLISILICLAIGFFSSFFTRDSISGWFKKLKKPKFNPPNYLFGPVWTLLYIMMGITLYLLWQNSAWIAILFFIIQLVLNFFWSYIFFTLKKLSWAFIEIIFLWIMIIVTIIISYPISALAAYLMIPYILWVSFASILNYSIFRLNR